MTVMDISENSDERKIKCVIWDLDNTIWDGILIEDENVVLRDGIFDIIKTLDSRGILQSIASRNNFDHAMEKVRTFGLEKYFLYPEIHWNSKVSSIKRITQSINIGLDSIAFIDDSPVELAEVAHFLPEVLLIDSRKIDGLLNMPVMNPRFITDESQIRRQMYMSDIERKKKEEVFEGPQEDFLASLDMELTIADAKEIDLKRAEELTLRTHQMNTTGYAYSYDELNHFLLSGDHKLWIAELTDKFGTYGKIGLVLIETKSSVWTVKLLLMSCRVMSRGVGTILISHILNEAKKHNVRLTAEMVPNDRNRIMYVTYKFANFKDIGNQGPVEILENDLTQIQPFPSYVHVLIKTK